MRRLRSNDRTYFAHPLDELAYANPRSSDRYAAGLDVCCAELSGLPQCKNWEVGMLKPLVFLVSVIDV